MKKKPPKKPRKSARADLKQAAMTFHDVVKLSKAAIDRAKRMFPGYLPHEIVSVGNTVYVYRDTMLVTADAFEEKSTRRPSGRRSKEPKP